MKLTEAQRRELAAMSERNYGSHYPDNYRPIKRLLEMEYLSRNGSRYGGGIYRITDLGRAALGADERNATPSGAEG